MAADEVSNTEIAQRVGVCRPTVSAWRVRRNRGGIAGLFDQNRPARTRAVDRVKIIATMLKVPSEEARHPIGLEAGRPVPADQHHHGGQGVPGSRHNAVAVGDARVLHRPGVGRQGHRHRRVSLAPPENALVLLFDE